MFTEEKHERRKVTSTQVEEFEPILQPVQKVTGERYRPGLGAMIESVALAFVGSVVIGVLVVLVVAIVWPDQLADAARLVVIIGAGVTILPVIIDIGALLRLRSIEYHIASTERMARLTEAHTSRQAAQLEGQMKTRRLAQKVEEVESVTRRMAITDDGDLIAFAREVILAKQSPSFRQWRDGSRLPSGRKLQHPEWKQDLIAPMVQVGALLPGPEGKGYERNPRMTFNDCIDQLQEAGHVQR